MVEFASEALGILIRNSKWMGWNLFLGLLPMAMILWIFRDQRKFTPLWWILGGVALAFLPNAPYVLTDVIHLIEAIKSSRYSVTMISIVIIPMYMAFFFIGFEAYVLSLLRIGRYLRKQGLKKFVLAFELVLSFICAGGIYLGRFHRFNSWDIIAQPDALVMTMLTDVARQRPMIFIGLTFLIVSVMYLVFKQVNLAVATYWTVKRAQRRAEQKPAHLDSIDDSTSICQV